MRYGSQETEKKEGDGEDFESYMTILPPEKVEIKRNLKAKDKRESILTKVTNKARRPIDVLEQHQEEVLGNQNSHEE